MQRNVRDSAVVGPILQIQVGQAQVIVAGPKDGRQSVAVGHDGGQRSRQRCTAPDRRKTRAASRKRDGGDTGTAIFKARWTDFRVEGADRGVWQQVVPTRGQRRTSCAVSLREGDDGWELELELLGPWARTPHSRWWGEEAQAFVAAAAALMRPRPSARLIAVAGAGRATVPRTNNRHSGLASRDRAVTA